jgi:acetyltransferase-like isoleucine patch superfamily enzyme
VAIAPGAVVLSGVKFTHGRSATGEASFIGEGCYLEDHSPVVAGANVWIAARCILLTASHEVGDQLQRAGRWWTAGITIESGSWLGGHHNRIRQLAPRASQSNPAAGSAKV